MVVLLMLIPLLAPSESGAPAGLKTIARALGIAALKVAPHQIYPTLIPATAFNGKLFRQLDLAFGLLENIVQ